jgi:hypothetical protein
LFGGFQKGTQVKGLGAGSGAGVGVGSALGSHQTLASHVAGFRTYGCDNLTALAVSKWQPSVQGTVAVWDSPGHDGV